jgi:hypothetical protein
LEENSYYYINIEEEENKEPFNGNISTDSNEEREKVELRRRTESNK